MGEIFERTIPDQSLEWTGERLTTAMSGQIEIEHLHRYFLARSFCRGLDVLDVASGEGYGAALLSQVAKSVVGVELSQQAVDHAAQVYEKPNLRYLKGDARKLPLGDASIDVLVSFETLEHFFEHDAFMKEAKRVLRSEGILIISSPERDVYSPLGSPANKYHVLELSLTEFEVLLKSTFRNSIILQQRPFIGSALVMQNGSDHAGVLTFERRGAGMYEVNPGLPRSPYNIAIASNADLPNVPNSLFIESSEIGELLSRPTDGARNDEMQEHHRQAELMKSNFKAELDAASETIRTQIALTEAAEGSAHNARVAQSVVAAELERMKQAHAAVLVEAEQSRRDQSGQMDAATASFRTALEAANEIIRAQLDIIQSAKSAAQQAGVSEAAAVAELERSRRDIEEKQRAWSVELAESEQSNLRLTNEAANHHQLSRQRDFLRKSLQKRSGDISALREQNSAMRLELNAAIQDIATTQGELSATRRHANEWEARHAGLRSRLESILRRFWIIRLGKLFPRRIRNFVRNRMLGSGS